MDFNDLYDTPNNEATVFMRNDKVEYNSMVKKYYIIICLVVIGIISVSISASAQQPSAPQDESLLTSRCQTAQKRLSGSVRTRDLRTRVDRMQAYLYIHERLNILTQRLEHNNQPRAKQLRESTTQLGILIEAFKNDYEIYDEARNSVASMKDCSTNIEDFKISLEFARTARQKVQHDVSAIHDLLSGSAVSELSELISALEQTSSGVGANE